LAKVHSIGAYSKSDIHIVVNDEQNPGGGCDFPEFHSQMIQIFGMIFFLPKLDNSSTTLDHPFQDF
jgi:hypothetical protein